MSSDPAKLDDVPCEVCCGRTLDGRVVISIAAQNSRIKHLRLPLRIAKKLSELLEREVKDIASEQA